MSDEKLAPLRAKIDKIDKQLLDLLQQRLKTVEEVGHIKTELGLPIYAPDREQAMLAARRTEAYNLGLNPDLIEDILRRAMRESYALEQNKGFKEIKPDLGNIVIIGGQGQMGQLFAKMFELSGYQVNILEKNDWQNANEYMATAGLVLISVPVDKTIEVINQLPKLPNDCILADLTSIKTEPLKAMLKKHQGPVVGLHPMFGPNIKSMAKEIVIQCNGRYLEKYQWLINQMQVWGAELKVIDEKDHDDAMGIIQALRHFTTFVYGVYLQQNNIDVKHLMELSSPIYRLELIMVGRLFAQNPELYAEIILSSSKHYHRMQDFNKCFANCLYFIGQQDKSEFIKQFSNVQNFLGSFADECLKESQKILQRDKDGQ